MSLEFPLRGAECSVNVPHTEAIGIQFYSYSFLEASHEFANKSRRDRKKESRDWIKNPTSRVVRVQSGTIRVSEETSAFFDI
jgi:hypothetical protein